MSISRKTSALELATLVSQALEKAGILATLSGGGAVSIFTNNKYLSKDLDFITSASKADLKNALHPLGFELGSDGRHFTHPDTDFFVEFPSGPLEFGDEIVQHADIPTYQTPNGPLRVITPTLSVKDRLAAYWHWNDKQSWDQAVMIVRSGLVSYDELLKFAEQEKKDVKDIEELWHEALT